VDAAGRVIGQVTRESLAARLSIDESS